MQALEAGITISGDRQLYVGRQPAKAVNCIIDVPGVDSRHARIGMCACGAGGGHARQ